MASNRSEDCDLLVAQRMWYVHTEMYGLDHIKRNAVKQQDKAKSLRYIGSGRIDSGPALHHYEIDRKRVEQQRD